METIYTHKTYIGSDKRGKLLFEAFREYAKLHMNGNISKLFIMSACEKVGRDYKTGLPSKDGKKPCGL